jgi:hypothetical protein
MEKRTMSAATSKTTLTEYIRQIRSLSIDKDHGGYRIATILKKLEEPWEDVHRMEANDRSFLAWVLSTTKKAWDGPRGHRSILDAAAHLGPWSVDLLSDATMIYVAAK